MTHKRARSSSSEEDHFYEVERIVGKRSVGGTTEYNVKWKGFPAWQNTWEPIHSLLHAQSAIDDFEHKHSPRKRLFRSEETTAPPMPQRVVQEDIKIVGVREVSGQLIWTAEPITGPPLIELPLAEARRRAPQALVDYLVSKLRFA